MADLHNVEGMLPVSLRTWSTHLLFGWPGRRFQSRPGRRQTDRSMWALWNYRKTNSRPNTNNEIVHINTHDVCDHRSSHSAQLFVNGRRDGCCDNFGNRRGVCSLLPLQTGVYCAIMSTWFRMFYLRKKSAPQILIICMICWCQLS